MIELTTTAAVVLGVACVLLVVIAASCAWRFDALQGDVDFWADAYVGAEDLLGMLVLEHGADGELTVPSETVWSWYEPSHEQWEVAIDDVPDGSKVVYVL